MAQLPSRLVHRGKESRTPIYSIRSGQVGGLTLHPRRGDSPIVPSYWNGPQVGANSVVAHTKGGTDHPERQLPFIACSFSNRSSDTVADDWHHSISPKKIIALAMKRLEARGKGILLLHDIHAATVAALPGLLKELKQKGFHVVHVVPALADRSGS